jgi:hypothetical protein
MSWKPRHKFNAKPCTADDIKFPSQLEKNYYYRLKRLQQAGEVLFFIRQPSFDLGGGVKYSADFLEFHADGTCHFVDCKGVETKEFIMKKKLVESLYPVKIEVVKKV